jgi:hypothetical protein
VRTVLVVLMLVGVSTMPCAVAGQANAPWSGTWALNLAKSTDRSGPPPFKRGTCTIEPWEDGVQFTYDLVRLRGGITHLEWRGRFDGRDYAVEGVEAVVTSAYTRVDNRTYDIVQKVDGDVTATARMFVSADGKTLTTVTTAKDAQGQRVTTTLVYDKP